MTAYSLDLRERIIRAVEGGEQTKRAVAALFEVHESFIYKLLRQHREVGHVAPLPHGGGHTAKLQEKQLALLTDLVAQNPDATLDELGTQLQKKARVKVGRTTLWRALEALDLPRKKRPNGRRKPIR
jgi:transposase